MQIHHAEIKQFSTNVLHWLASVSKEDEYMNTFDIESLLGTTVLTSEHLTKIGIQHRYKLSTSTQIGVFEFTPFENPELKPVNDEISLFISIFAQEADTAKNPSLSFNISSTNTPSDLIQMYLQDPNCNAFFKEKGTINNFILRIAGLNEFMKHPQIKLIR